MVKQEIKFACGLTFKNPVLTASGTFGYGHEFEDLIDLNRLGGIIVKGTTLEPREGNPYPRMAETPSGMLNAVGLQNKGVDYFIDSIYPTIKDLKTALIVNVSGRSIDDYVGVTEKLTDLDKIVAIEVNISCPNVKQGGMSFGTTCEGASEITREIRRKWDRAMIVKLTPNVTDIVSIAKAVETEGADAVSMVNTFLGMAIDVERQEPLLSTITGGLSGPAIRPIAVRMVWQTAKAISIPVIGLGGIMNGRDALEFILAGASAIQVGTANFVNPHVTMEIVDYIEDYCRRKGVSDITQLVGAINH
ncbi:MAG: dihydroorotate dehydrogenase [Muribaculaceae bacterium]|nr:dihydroorotate dehydrogenase [Muribaculaceae bacterium]